MISGIHITYIDIWILSITEYFVISLSKFSTNLILKQLLWENPLGTEGI
jgi:hypothetical protein